MAILVTGGTGFIGSHLVPFLRKRGHDVVLFEGNITQKETTRNFVAGKSIGAVIHLAAAVNSRDNAIFHRVNVEGTRNIVEMCRRLKVSRLIFMSSIRVLSGQRDPYIDSKKSAEAAVVSSNTPYVILRPSLIYGHGDRKNISLLIRLMNFLPAVPALELQIQPLFIEDMIRVIEASLRYPANSVLNITGPHVLCFKEILKIIKMQSKNKFLIINYPRFFELVLRVLSLFPFSPVPRWQVNTFLAGEVYEGDNWEETLKIKATPFFDGVKTLVT